MAKCKECKNPSAIRVTTVLIQEIDGVRCLIKDVPATICEECNEIVYDDEKLKQLEKKIIPLTKDTDGLNQYNYTDLVSDDIKEDCDTTEFNITGCIYSNSNVSLDEIIEEFNDACAKNNWHFAGAITDR